MSLIDTIDRCRMESGQKYRILSSLLLATGTVFALFSWEGHKGFSLWDEGFLWYGVQRVMRGEVPLRDFMAYNPGRYYWSAALMSGWGNNGIMALRGAAAVFQGIGVFAGLFLIARSQKKQNLFYLLLSAATLTAWMFPHHRKFDMSLSILLIGLLAFLVRKPVSGRYFFTGIGVGLAAVFGSNHGVYGAAGSLGVMVWLNIKRAEGPGFIKGCALWTAGVLTGFMPILFMVWRVPGFAAAFWESIRFLFEIKATNISLPVPWPWRVDFNSVPLGKPVRGVLVGLFFIGTAAFGALLLFRVIGQKLQNKQSLPALVAASFLAFPYAHYAYSRADVEHLALGIFPLLVGCLALLAAQPVKVKWPLSLLLCAVSLWMMRSFHPGWQCHISKQWVNTEISGSNLVVSPGTASDIALLRKLVEQYAPGGQSFIVVPFWPGAYPLFERKSPLWEIYGLFPRSEAFEQAEIQRIKTAKPGFALVYDFPLDRRDSLKFQNTHPLIYRYIQEHFDRLPDSPKPAYQIYRAKRITP